MMGKRTSVALMGLTWLGFSLGIACPARATQPMMKQAKEAGFTDATSCAYCHNEKLPKKGAETPNERGKWLVEQKEKRKAEKIDVNWLKEYVAPSK